MTDSHTPEVCEAIVTGDYTSHPCGRKAKEDGLCGIHLAARNKRRTNDAKHRAERERGDALLAEAREISARLRVKVAAHYHSYGRGYTGDFVVPGDWLRQQA